jgi:ribosomal protein L29
MKKLDELKKYRAMSGKEISAELVNLEKSLTIESLKVAAGKAEDYSKLSVMRKTLARAKTILNEKELENE